MNARSVLAAMFGSGLVLASHGAGCVDRDPAHATAYERCDSELPAAPCSDGTVCLGVNPFGESVKDPGQLCTRECIDEQGSTDAGDPAAVCNFELEVCPSNSF